MSNEKKSGFTLLEVIIVVIIIGVLATLALPRFFSTIEYSRAVEALQSISAIRQSIERCYLPLGVYTNCNNFNRLDFENPGLAPNNHFTYSMLTAAQRYTITATRNTRDGGDGNSIVAITYDGPSGTITRTGTGAFGAFE